MAKKVRKIRKFRGSTTHGWGAKKRHRGEGTRGGRGMAGAGKRAKQKKISILKQFGTAYFGKHGFRRPQKVLTSEKAINICDLDFKETKIDLNKLGYTKLLGKGKPSQKYDITVKSCSKKAKEKIEKAGGKVNVLD